MAESSSLPGGFVDPSQSLPSPAPSSALSTSTVTSSLPRQRLNPLRPGSAKENSVIQYVDTHILAINRRHAKKFSSSFAEQDDTARGYEDFKEVAKDIETVADVLWVSGTPSLQTPYLISLAVLVDTYLPDFTFRPRPTFRLLRKLDTMFASLLQGENVEAHEALPGFDSRRDHVSMTEKVRIKGIVETARIAVVEAQDSEGERLPDNDEDEDEDEDEEMEDWTNTGIDDYVEAPGRWEMESAKVYEKTIQLIGDELGRQGNPT